MPVTADSLHNAVIIWNSCIHPVPVRCCDSTSKLSGLSEQLTPKMTQTTEKVKALINFRERYKKGQAGLKSKIYKQRYQAGRLNKGPGQNYTQEI